MSAFMATSRRERISTLRHLGQFMMVPVFFVLATMLFPLVLGTDVQTLGLAAPGLITIAALFSALLPLDQFFNEDYHDGTLDTLMLCPQPLCFYVSGKIMAHWIRTGLPLILIAPVLSIMLGLTGCSLYVIAALIPTTIIFGLIGALGAALTLDTKQGSVLLALLIVPLYIPVLIFCAGTIDLARSSLAVNTPLLLLWAFTTLLIPLIPIATSAILKWQVR